MITSLKIYVDLMNEDETLEYERLCAEETSKNHMKYKPVKETRLWTLIDRIANLITVDIELPEGNSKQAHVPYVILIVLLLGQAFAMCFTAS